VAFHNIVNGIDPKIVPPLVRWMRGEDICVGPGIMIPNNGRKPRAKNIFRHIWEHGLSFLYKISMRRVHKNINAPSKIMLLNFSPKKKNTYRRNCIKSY
jgi:hypothetical protein